MSHPWIFSEIRAALSSGEIPTPPSLEEKWRFICGHCAEEIAWRGNAVIAMRSLRGRLMAYTKGMPGGARLREGLSHVESMAELEDLAAGHLAGLSTEEDELMVDS